MKTGNDIQHETGTKWANHANQSMPIFGKEPVKSKPLKIAKMIFDLLILVIFNFNAQITQIAQIFVSYWVKFPEARYL